MKLSALIAALVVALVRPDPAEIRCHGELVAYLTAAKAVSETAFESDLMIQARGSSIGQELEFVNLDLHFSRIQRFDQAAQGLGTLDQGRGYQRVDLQISPRFDSWFDGQGFGSRVDFESQVSLDAFADLSDPTPWLLADDETLRIATLTMDYGGLELSAGDSVTLDVLGQADASGSRTTSFVLRDPGTEIASMVEPVFQRPETHSEGAGVAAFESTITVAVVPEPSVLLPLCLGLLSALLLRRQRHH